MHFLRNVLAQAPKNSGEMTAAAIHTTYAQPKTDIVHNQLDAIAGMPERQPAKAEAGLHDAATDLLASTDFPPNHWKKIRSTNPLKRLNNEIKHRTDLVDVSPNPDTLLHLTDTVLDETHNECQTPTAG